jgi:hypothetical protein
VDISLPFTDTLIAQSGKLMLQHAGIRGAGTTEAGSISGTLDPQETAHYLFAVLAEHGVAAETITVGSASVAMTVTAAAARGTISASATATISGVMVPLSLNVEL